MYDPSALVRIFLSRIVGGLMRGDYDVTVACLHFGRNPVNLLLLVLRETRDLFNNINRKMPGENAGHAVVGSKTIFEINVG
jgi:hypothetical protein